MTDLNQSDEPSFDFEGHRIKAEAQYQRVRPVYESFAEEVRRILKESIGAVSVRTASIDARAKEVASFGKKASRPANESPESPKYRNPVQEITDLAGVRVIVFFPKDIAQIERQIRAEFVVIDRVDKAEDLLREGRLGYQSLHFLVKLAPSRSDLAEYRRYRDLVAELQVRTVLQHAWAEIEHDIQYKTVATIPGGLRRRFLSLAGLIEIADREFQAIQDDDERLTLAARASVEQGHLAEVEITGDALKTYLNKRLGPDGRITDSAYEWTANNLRQMGFTNLGQLEACLEGLDDDVISRKASGTRQGQLTRLEFSLLAGMGREYIERHPWSHEEWFRSHRESLLQKLQRSGVQLKNCAPPRTDHGSILRAAYGLPPEGVS